MSGTHRRGFTGQHLTVSQINSRKKNRTKNEEFEIEENSIADSNGEAMLYSPPSNGDVTNGQSTFERSDVNSDDSDSGSALIATRSGRRLQNWDYRVPRGWIFKTISLLSSKQDFPEARNERYKFVWEVKFLQNFRQIRWECGYKNQWVWNDQSKNLNAHRHLQS